MEDGICTAYVDGIKKLSYAVEKTGYGWIGITSATGDGQNFHAVKNVTVVGNRSTSIDGKFLNLKLTHKKLSDNVSDTSNGVYEYEITAKIQNCAEATAQNITTTLDLGEGLRVADGTQLSIELDDIASGESVYAKWTVYADFPESNIDVNYSVTASIGDFASVTQENHIYLVTPNNQKAELD